MQNKKGFTLIELMIVVAIIAILAMIAVPMYQSYMERARNSATQSLLHQLSLSESAYSVDHNSEYVFTTGSNPSPTFSSMKSAIEALAGYGFRPDPNVAFVIHGPSTAGENGYRAYAAHRTAGSTMYFYDELTGGGTQPVELNTSVGAGGGHPTELNWYTFTMTGGTFTATESGTKIKIKAATANSPAKTTN